MWKFASLVLLSFVYGCCCADVVTQDDLNKLCTVQGIFTVSNPNDCRSFILCKYNVAEIISCPSTKPCYNEKMQACSTPDTDGCSCNIESDAIKSYCRSKPDSWLLKVPAEDCSIFYVCMGDELDPVPVRCPNGWHYSRAEEDCVTPLRAGCQSLQRMCNDKDNGFRFPAVNCMEFYECNAEAEINPILRVCPVGQFYDGNTRTCIAAEDSTCINENENQPTTTTTSTSTSTSVLPKPSCTTENEGQLFSHPDCYKFYICVNEYPMLFYCGGGYYFDAVLKICRKDVDSLCPINAK